MKYQGDGRFLVGVPARDLEDGEIERLAAGFREPLAAFTQRLTETGIYKRVTKTAKAVTSEDPAHE